MNDRLSHVLLSSASVMQQNAVIQRDYREAQIEKRRAANSVAMAKFRAAHPERLKAIIARRALKHAAEVAASRTGVSPSLIAEADRLIESWRVAVVWNCAYCGKAEPQGKRRTADHVIALSKGGKHEPGNLKPACQPCNSRKGTRSSYYA